MVPVIRLWIVVLILPVLANRVISQEKNMIPFPDNHGKPVDVHIDCREKRETDIDLASHVRFYLYRRLNKYHVTETQMKINETLPNTILKQEPTKILIHGFINTLKAEMIQKIKDAYLDPTQVKSESTNVIAVDWGDLAGLSIQCYIGPMKRTIDVGRYLATFIDYLVGQEAIDLGRLHLIGHSLGAHVAGIAGKHVTSGKVARITGLDPAGVRYRSVSIENKLDKTDAIFVDVIHTDTQLLGYKQPCGHIDFYPHGGGYQPGCVYPTCSHSRAHVYFKESIHNGIDYTAYECDSLDDVSSCHVLKINEDGCYGCQSNSSNFMGEFAASPQDDTLYLSYPPVPGSEGGGATTWTLWGFPTVLGVAAFSSGAGIAGTAMWGWRKYTRHAATPIGL